MGDAGVATGAAPDGAANVVNGTTSTAKFRGLWEKHSTVFDAWLVAAAGQVLISSSLEISNEPQ